MSDNHQPLAVLIVEDNPGDLFLLEELLHVSALPVRELYTATNAAMAVKILQQREVDLVLLDLSLPDSNGLQSYLLINQHADTIPIIVLTGLIDMDVALDTMAKGAQDYLVKGEFDEKLLYKSIQYSVERKRSLRKLQEERQLKQKEITEAVIRVQEKERYEISKELHDNVNQQLTVAMMYIATAMKGGDNHQELLKQSSGFIFTAIEEIRKLSKALVTPLIKDFGLAKAIDGLVEDILVANEMNIEFFAQSFYEEDINYEFKLNIFRIVQEQMNNIIKHANAANVIIELYRDEKIRLSVKDDGIGFDLAEKRKGIGLNNIISRTELYNGSIALQATPGDGCRLHIDFPATTDILVKVDPA